MLLNRMDRIVLREHPNSLYASRLRGYLAKLHMKRELDRLIKKIFKL